MYLLVFNFLLFLKFLDLILQRCLWKNGGSQVKIYNVLNTAPAFLMCCCREPSTEGKPRRRIKRRHILVIVRHRWLELPLSFKRKLLILEVRKAVTALQ